VLTSNVAYMCTRSVGQHFSAALVGDLVGRRRATAVPGGVFSLCVNNFGSSNKTYGTIAGAVLDQLYRAARRRDQRRVGASDPGVSSVSRDTSDPKAQLKVPLVPDWHL
jgi:hypothetical protein